MVGSERGFHLFVVNPLLYRTFGIKIHAKTAKIPVQVSIKYLCFKFMH